MGGLALLFLLIVLVVLLCLAVIGVLAGALLGAALGAATGGLFGAMKASAGEKELGAHRGIVTGSCLGTLGGLVVAIVLIAIGWSYLAGT
jgi:hypothetical protein